MRTIEGGRAATIARRGLWSLLAIALMGPTLGCGYALVGRGSNIPESVEAVYLEALVNRTQRSQVDQFSAKLLAN